MKVCVGVKTTALELVVTVIEAFWEAVGVDVNWRSKVHDAPEASAAPHVLAAMVPCAAVRLERVMLLSVFGFVRVNRRVFDPAWALHAL